MLYIGIPAYNEATTIGVLLWRLRSVLADVSREYEVVVYDDASTDGTAKTLEPYTRVLPLTLLSGSRRVGYAGAIDALVRHVARTTRYPRRDALLLLQGDFTDPPALVPEFLRRFEGGADLIIGERATVGDAPTAVRRLWSASRWVLRPFVGVTDVRDLTSSYRLVRIAVLRDLLKSVGDAPVATGDVWAANADFLLRTAALSRRVETIPVTPTFGVRTRETRRAAWPDTMALAKWGWGRRGQRVVVKVIARTVEVPAEVDEAPIEAPERVAVPERSERPDRGARGDRGERRPRRESSERVPERPRRSRERPAPRATEAAPELVAGAAESAESESVESPSREARTRRKRGRRDRTRKESGLAATSGESEPMTEPSSGTAAEGAEREGAEREGAEREGPSASEGAEPLDMSEEGVARRRKRTRRGRRRKSGAASEGSAEDGAASTQSNDESSNGPSDGPSDGPRDESRDSSEARRSGERAPRAESPYADEQEPSAPRERSADESETGSEDGDGAKRRRSRRGRRGGGRRRAEGNEEGSGEASSEGPSAGGSEAGGESRRIGPEGAERSEP